jgi:Mn2+/Fe2+ NRAMP family transporter
MAIFKSVSAKISKLGPAILVTSAFIGPGTVTVCTLAGYQFGYSLLWALLFSIFATIILQEMCARLGLISQRGLGEIIKTELETPIAKYLGIFLVLAAIVIGNSAYEAGNISGATLGLKLIYPSQEVSLFGFNLNVAVLAIGIIATLLFISGSYKLIEKTLIFLVGLMSIVFLATAIIVRPDLNLIFSGLVIPSFPENSLIMIIGLIGTTVVPYNFFLHSSSIKEKWQNPEDLGEVRFDTIASIAVGGLISIAIVICAAASSTNSAGSDINNLASQLEPVLGVFAPYFLGFGLFAAGISSAITAPLAAAYTASGILGLPASTRHPIFKAICIGILAIGLIVSLAGFKPIQVIQFAQFANGLLLPTVAIFLVWIMNRKKLLGKFVNSKWQNLMGIFIILVTLVLGAKSIINVISSL